MHYESSDDDDFDPNEIPLKNFENESDQETGSLHSRDPKEIEKIMGNIEMTVSKEEVDLVEL